MTDVQVRGLDDGDANETLKLKSAEGEVSSECLQPASGCRHIQSGVTLNSILGSEGAGIGGWRYWIRLQLEIAHAWRPLSRLAIPSTARNSPCLAFLLTAALSSSGAPSDLPSAQEDLHDVGTHSHYGRGRSVVRLRVRRHGGSTVAHKFVCFVCRPLLQPSRPTSFVSIIASSSTAFLPHCCFRRSPSSDKEADDIPLLNVKSAVLKKVVEYMRYHAENPPKDIEKPLKSPNMAEVVSQVSPEGECSFFAGQSQCGSA